MRAVWCGEDEQNLFLLALRRRVVRNECEFHFQSDEADKNYRQTVGLLFAESESPCAR